MRDDTASEKMILEKYRYAHYQYLSLVNQAGFCFEKFIKGKTLTQFSYNLIQTCLCPNKLKQKGVNTGI